MYSGVGKIVLLFALLSWGGVSCYSPSKSQSPLLETIHRSSPQFVEVGGNQIAYVEAGQGEPLVLIHGFGGSIWNWEYQYSDLSTSYHVIILDLLGSGMSDKPEVSYTPHLLVTFFEQFLDTLEIQQATLVGNSMGAGLAMAMALTAPDRVNNLVLISGFPPNPRESITSPIYNDFLYRRPPLWMAQLGNWIAARWAAKTSLKEVIYNHDLITPLVLERSYQNRRRADFLPPLFSLLDHIDQWEEEFGNRLDGIQHATLILWGADDRVFPPAVGEQLYKTVPNARFYLITEAGHIPQWEQPSQVNALIREFLTRSPS